MYIVPLDEFVDINPEVKLNKGKEYPCVMMEDITPGSRYVSSKGKKAYKGGSRFQNGDVLFARITPCLENGKIAQYVGKEDGFGSTEFFIFRQKEGISDQGYIFYLALSDIIRKPAEKSFYGVSGRQRADLNVVRKVEVPAHPLPVQRKIAEVLSAYDDLIEVNTRRIHILEHMAQAVYHEWFGKVDTQFLPQGWEAIKYSDLLESYSGGDWGVEEPDEKENYPCVVIRGADFISVRSGGNIVAPSRYISEGSIAKRKLHAGDIIVENSVNASSRCVGTTLLITPGILQRVGYVAICASFCKNFRLREPKLAPLVYLHMKYLYEEKKMPFYQNVAANGIGNFQAKRFVDIEAIAVPKDKEKLNTMIDVLTNLTSSVYADQNANLRRTRDLLLPRLVSGEVGVDGVEMKGV